MDMKQNPKICMITNIGPHYRYPIFEKISKELGCDFYLGDKVYLPIKTFNYKDLSGYKATLTNHFWQILLAIEFHQIIIQEIQYIYS